jgi:peptide/nickel transport system permease protein
MDDAQSTLDPAVADDEITSNRAIAFDSPAAADAVREASRETVAIATPPSRRFRNLLPRRSAKLVGGLVIVGAIVLFGILGPLIAQPPRDSDNPSLEPPSAEHWLGTTKLGYDVFAQLAWGAQGSLMIGLVAGTIALVLAVVFGVLAGYFGGVVDEALSLLTNIMLVIPGLPLVMVIAAYVQRSEGLGDFARSSVLVAIVLGITGWAGSAVVLRAQARSLRTREYVAAARVAGERAWRVILVEILPNLVPLLAAQFIFGIIFAILGEAGLSYLGLGATGSITWGTVLNDAQTGQAVGTGAWWWFVPPGAMIAALGAGLSLINFAIDEVVNPKLRLAPENARQVRRAAKAGRGVTETGVIA